MPNNNPENNKILAELIKTQGEGTGKFIAREIAKLEKEIGDIRTIVDEINENPKKRREKLRLLARFKRLNENKKKLQKLLKLLESQKKVEAKRELAAEGEEGEEEFEVGNLFSNSNINNVQGEEEEELVGEEASSQSLEDINSELEGIQDDINYYESKLRNPSISDEEKEKSLQEYINSIRDAISEAEEIKEILDKEAKPEPELELDKQLRGRIKTVQAATTVAELYAGFI